jgi:hypothetical protein
MRASNESRIGIALAAVALLAGGAWLTFGGSKATQPREEPAGEEREQHGGRSASAESLQTVAEDVRERRRIAFAGDQAKQRLAEELRARLREAREARKARRDTGSREVAPVMRPGAAATESAEERASLDREYIRDAMREIVPLLAECYELAREEEPSLAGRLVVEFDIEGEPEVGGVIEASTIAEDSELRHPLLDECVRETMYVLALPAPDGPGTVHVRYPLVMSPDDPEEGAAE